MSSGSFLLLCGQISYIFPFLQFQEQLTASLKAKRGGAKTRADRCFSRSEKTQRLEGFASTRATATA